MRARVAALPVEVYLGVGFFVGIAMLEEASLLGASRADQAIAYLLGAGSAGVVGMVRKRG